MVGSYPFFGSMSHRKASPAVSSRGPLHPLARAHASRMGASLCRPTTTARASVPAADPSPLATPPGHNPPARSGLGFPALRVQRPAVQPRDNLAASPSTTCRLSSSCPDPSPASAWRLPTMGPSPRGPLTSFLRPSLLTSGGHTLSRYWDLSSKARSVACASSKSDSQQVAANDTTPSPAVSGSPVPPAVPGVGAFLGRFWLQVFFGALFGVYVIHFVSL